jgi:signal transduction histidine kinase
MALARSGLLMSAEHAMSRGAPHADCDAVEDTLGRILRGLAVALGSRRAVAFVIERGGAARLAASRGVSARDQRYVRVCQRAGATALPYWRRLDAARHPLFLDAVETCAALPPAWTARLGVGPHLAVPLRARDDTLLGALVLETGAPTPAQVRLAVAVGAVAATAIANAYTARARADEAARQEILLEIVRDVSSALPLPELLALICRRTVEGAFGADRVTIFDYHRRSRGYVPLADFGTPAHVVERFIHQPYTTGSTPHREEILVGRTVVIDRAAASAPEDVALLDRSDLYTLALLPLRVDNTTRGMMTVGTAARHEFTPEQVRGLEVVAHHAATAIAQARSLRATEKAARFRAAVSTLAVELNAETSRSRALELLCARARAMFRASAGALLLPAEGRLRGVAADAEGTLEPDALSVAVGAGEHPAARAFQSGEVVRADEIVKDDPALGVHGIRSALAIPLVASEAAAGVLLIGAAHRRHFDSSVVDEARVLGALAATALRNLGLMTQLHATNAELRRVSSLKDQFLANVSHDLRTPLNVIVGYAQLAREGTFGALPPELANVLERIIGSAREQLALVEDLLDLSRIELDSLTVRPATVALAPLFAELEFALASMIRGRPVRGRVQAVPPALAVHADRDRLRQILTNLLGNAAKFTDTGAIEVCVEEAGGTVRIAVRDTGRGVAPEEQERIFEPFRQIESERATLGAGLGLAISRRLATLMGGTLRVESALGAGSTFWLTLPAATAAAPRGRAA